MLPTLRGGALACAVLTTSMLAFGALAAPAAPPTRAAIVVKIDNFTFGPQVLTVSPGTTVTWINEDDAPHTIVANDKSFRSKAIDTDERFSWTFTKAGSFDYFCSLHPHMTAHVVVKPA